ncbi:MULTISPECIES: virulence associated lipoprotein [Borreliella]|uniref:Lipoprotein, Borrelia protein family PFam60 n=3 Tax=Borreliella TaxID=64895 RepID=Q0SLK6_BORAP|nr:virulence associated lipoprotein [Borreliella bavariensis]ABH02272.1 hypothetical protein BAPKO_3016 [Borreliella afzelii PKo]AEL70601.1 putative lipoprotein, Borrelia protein family PFam60 [Borreliella afzelii PKo]MBB5141651.1 hypothetical protein [Borreliella afzelii]
MKYYVIIISIFVFLFLYACNPNFNTNQKDTKNLPNKKELKLSTEVSSNQEEDLNKKIKNTLLNSLKNLIELANTQKEKYIKMMGEEPSDQYGMDFDKFSWGKNTEKVSSNTARSIKYRRHTYTILSSIDTKEFKEFANIIKLSTKDNIYNLFSGFGQALDIVTDYLYSKKETLDKLDASDLEKLKNSFEKLLSTIKIVSEMSKQLLLDYKNDENLIKTDINMLKSHVNTLHNQFKEQTTEVETLQQVILSI